VRLNLNKLAAEVTQREGGAVNLPIAQVKEVMRLTLEALARVPASVALEAIERHRRAGPGRTAGAPDGPDGPGTQEGGGVR
jgi:hypothetical protein